MLRESNWEANELAQIAFGLKMGEELTDKLIMIKKKNHPSIFKRGIDLDIFNNDMNIARDWTKKIQRIFGESKQEGSLQNEGSSLEFCSTGRRAIQKRT